MSEAIKYAENFTTVLKPSPAELKGYAPHGQGADGYGRKITSSWMVRFDGNPRLYRVYICQFSNSGTAYCIKGGETLYFKSTDFLS